MSFYVSVWWPTVAFSKWDWLATDWCNDYHRVDRDWILYVFHGLTERGFPLQFLVWSAAKCGTATASFFNLWWVGQLVQFKKRFSISTDIRSFLIGESSSSHVCYRDKNIDMTISPPKRGETYTCLSPNWQLYFCIPCTDVTLQLISSYQNCSMGM